MDHTELLRRLAETLDRLGLVYLVTGSTATIAYGEPRFTNDIDVVIDVPRERIDELLAAFPSNEFYLSRTAVDEAIRLGRQFNIIHPTSGLKIDVIVATSSEFDRQRLERGRRLAVLGESTVRFASPEDVIIKKLDYYREGQSEKHLRDIVGVLRVLGAQADRQYIEQWVSKLQLDEAWRLVLARLGN